MGWACPSCDGLGTETFFDPMLVVPQDDVSLKDGAIMPWTGAQSPYYTQTLESLAKHFKFAMTTPWQDIPAATRQQMSAIISV